MAPPFNLAHRRTHNLLLISKLLSQREQASPFTLVLDTLEQPARPLVREYIRRANLGRCFVIFLAFETVQVVPGVDAFVSCWDKSPTEISKVVASSMPNGSQRVLILIDSLMSLAILSQESKASHALNLTAYLSSFLVPARPSKPVQASLVAVYHTDVPTFRASLSYSPSPLSTLTYLATTILTVHSLANQLAIKAAHDRSLSTPVFGLAEEAEGVLVGLKANARNIKPEDRGIVIEMEHRRKSGRSVHEWYFLPSNPSQNQQPSSQAFREIVTLLDDHPLFKRRQEEQSLSEHELAGMTFELGLTDRQREEREGVVLPYFDAQKAAAAGLAGPGEGGRILYDMGVEDDFDEEEDEI